MDAYEEDEPSGFQKYRVIISGGLIAVIAVAVWFGQKRFSRTMPSRGERNVILVNLPPPLPLPPPPPARSELPPTESEQKMITQEPVNEAATKSAEPSKGAPQAASETPALGTGIQGDGTADGFGLGVGNSFGSGAGKTIGGGGASRWGWYANKVQSAISQALQSNDHTRTADFRIDAQIWTDRTGRITRARIVGSTGNGALDNAMTNEVLVGLILQEPPPDGMPMPIVLRLTAQNASAALSR